MLFSTISGAAVLLAAASSSREYPVHPVTTISNLSLLIMIISQHPVASPNPCPYAINQASSSLTLPLHGQAYNRRRDAPAAAAKTTTLKDFGPIKADIKTMFTTPQDFWPPDFGNYAPFFIRLAWHCAGSFRHSDGRGGCDGARIRHNPEHSWPDNTNLDKALRLLQPLKAKYGDAITWGDLIVLTGTTAIESMGGPVLGFCAGRVDDADGSDSFVLGPTPEQEAVSHCKVNGECTVPFGPTTVGLIYVNPEGPLGVPDPNGSIANVRQAFGNMGFNDRETVAIIGGGHAFGKTHGACTTGPGPSPIQDPTNPWPGTCGSGPLKGKGNNTFTSGFEGPWTTTPQKWTNEYFSNLLSFNWSVFVGPGGHHQWQPSNPSDANAAVPRIRMLTADLSLIYDPSYLALVKEYASNITSLEDDFKHAWYKLMTHDMGPRSRCVNADAPPAQPFQDPLPPPPTKLADFKLVKQDIVAALTAPVAGVTAEAANKGNSYAALVSALAYQCASTYRETDHRGGCNGARIRLAPENTWPANAGLDAALSILAPIKAKYGDSLTWADLIVLAGYASNEQSGKVSFEFKGGRSDDVAGEATSKEIAPRDYYTSKIVEFRDNMMIMGLSAKEAVALQGRMRSGVRQGALGYTGTYTATPSTLSNAYFKALTTESWQPIGPDEYQAAGKQLYMQGVDLALLQDAEFAPIVQQFANNNEAFLNEFRSAWQGLMTADFQ
ncbi:hypothetical protein HK101_011488 [Irineochytrium annulatum]|nr:hypothetical protein HK101_011488 [Irineochytrium annulatum]